MQNKQVMSYKEATGVVHYNMTNDYMFCYILQKNEKVLKGLICALLHFQPECISKVEITNPINLNEDIKGKAFILNINIMLNDNARINLEMQVENKHNYTLFPDAPEFYSDNMMMNVKNLGLTVQ